ncbi:MAG: helix-turn-helix transcriptional regulator, partial [Lachnospiraceae bacterium]
MSVAYTIWFLRQEKDYSIKALSDLANLSQKTIRNFEKDYCRPGEKEIVKLAFAFGVSPLCFVECSDENRSEVLKKLPAGKRIQTLRVWSRISVRKLAEKTGIEESRIRDYESLRAIPSPEDMCRCSAMLETGADILAGLDYETEEAKNIGE